MLQQLAASMGPVAPGAATARSAFGSHEARSGQASQAADAAGNKDVCMPAQTLVV